MVHPSDPRQPNGGAEQFGETQVGVPYFNTAGVPQQPAQPGYPQPQYSQPQYGQPQYSQTQQPAPQQPAPQPQYGQPQYGQQPFGAPQQPGGPQFQQPPFHQGPFPPGQYGPFPYGPPPKKSRKPLIFGLISILAVAAIVATVMVMAPWKSTPEEKTLSFALGDGVSVQVRLPAGWDAQSDTEDGKTLIRIHEDGDDRILTQLSDNLRSLSKTGSGTAMHTIVMFSDKCTTSPSGQDWSTKNRDDSSTKHTERWLYASSKVDDRRCINLSAVDSAADSVTAGSTARKTLQKLIDEDRVTASKSV
ncbi:hypothetical protein [Gordonia phthalatica]|uniref:hypothetical protein n=1 Tax=Gordonia phthalatica TaxID=1136941 RepID=UPI000782DD5E|nr:hypothetical protein [Gordonia phthalatica]